MLGSPSEAVQEAWLRLSRSDTSGVENLGGWLTMVVARVCLNMLRSGESRREEPLDAHVPEPIVSREAGIDPRHEALLADSVGLALLVVLEMLAPAERVAFVLHDMFDLPFDEIAPVVGRSPAAATQLASRARRRVQGAATVPDADLTRRREIVDAFLAASRGGDFGALLAMLDPDVVLRADPAAVRAGASREVRGAAAVADTFSGRARFAQPALVNGAVGAVWAPGGRPRVVFGFTITRGKIVEIDLLADPAHLCQLDLAVLTRSRRRLRLLGSRPCRRTQLRRLRRHQGRRALAHTLTPNRAREQSHPRVRGPAAGRRHRPVSSPQGPLVPASGRRRPDHHRPAPRPRGNPGRPSSSARTTRTNHARLADRIVTRALTL